MAAPDFLNNGFRYLVTAGVTDVNTIISDLNTELVANGWTDTGGGGTGPFKSPVVNSYFMLITLTRVSATRLRWVCTDQYGTLINNQTSNTQDIDAAGCAVRYYTGPDYCIVQTERATPECFGIWRLNVWPEDPEKTRASFVATRGPRNDVGTYTAANVEIGYVFLLQLGGTTYSAMTYYLWPKGAYAAASMLVTPSGADVFLPYDFPCSTHQWLGRVPNALICDDGLAYDSEHVVPVDTGVTGTFRVVYLTTSAYRRLAVRIA